MGQGCVAIEGHSTLLSEKKQAIRDCLNNPQSEACLLAERAFLRQLEGGCSIPAFALASLQGDSLSLTGGLVSLDGSTNITDTRSGNRVDAAILGQELGIHILASGGKELLAEIRQQQQ